MTNSSPDGDRAATCEATRNDSLDDVSVTATIGSAEFSTVKYQSSRHKSTYQGAFNSDADDEGENTEAGADGGREWESEKGAHRESPLHTRKSLRVAADGDQVLFEFKRQPIFEPEIAKVNDRSAPQQSFQYSALDHGLQSIRLIRIRATLTEEGQIQCDLRNAMIGDKYSCLSYIWGDASEGNWILLEGQDFWIRQNLYDFFRFARRKSRIRDKWLWIDALCIDQSTVAERNHQVQQMGQVYTGATEVISWLGSDRQIALFLKESSEDRACPIGYTSFCHSRYWDRAWITQEIVLARRVRFMAKNATLDGKRVPFSNEQICQLRILNLHPQTAHSLRGRGLIYLLDRFRLKKSENSRDRIFSLLALCGDGSDLQVDYDMPSAALAQSVLRACKLSTCLCSFGIVNDVLDMMPDLEGQLQTPQSFAQLRLPAEPVFSCPQSCCESTPMLHWKVRKDVPRWQSYHVSLDLRCLCSTYRGTVIMKVNKSMEVLEVDEKDRYIRDRTDEFFWHGSRKTCAILGDHERTLHISFELLSKMARFYQFGNRCCERVAAVGTTSSGSEGSHSLLSICN